MAKQETRQMLMDAFFSIYMDKPINRIGIKEVTEKAGFHRSTFYEYFSDIYDLLQQEEGEIYNLQRELIMKPVNEGALTLQNGEILNNLRKLFELKGERIAILIGDNGDAAFRRKLKERIKEILMSEKMKKGDRKSEYIAEFASAGVLSVLEKAYTEKTDVEELMRLLYPTISKVIG